MLFISSFVNRPPLTYGNYEYPKWAQVLGWCVTASSISCIPVYAICAFCLSSGGFKQRMRALMQPEAELESPSSNNIEEDPASDFKNKVDLADPTKALADEALAPTVVTIF